jgi:hypothetical protein
MPNTSKGISPVIKVTAINERPFSELDGTKQATFDTRPMAVNIISRAWQRYWMRKTYRRLKDAIYRAVIHIV